MIDWERRWAPYAEATYRAVLDAIRPDDVVLDIGAGDLRLARRMAALARKVYAIELDPEIAAAAPTPLPRNLELTLGDARTLPFPEGVTLGVLLMRHCRHFDGYAHKLRAIGCTRLMTNARWCMDVECVNLQAKALPFEGVRMGWYACRCGAVGFVPGPPEELTETVEAHVHEVTGCPECARERNQKNVRTLERSHVSTF